MREEKEGKEESASENLDLPEKRAGSQKKSTFASDHGMTGIGAHCGCATVYGTFISY